MDRSTRTKLLPESLDSTKTSPPIREGDLVYITGEVREVSGVNFDEDFVYIQTHDGHGDDRCTHTLTHEKAHEALVARDEDMYSTTTLTLRFQESMLMSQIVLMKQAQMQDTDPDWVQSMVELKRTLYAVRFLLDKRGARRAQDGRDLSL